MSNGVMGHTATTGDTIRVEVSIGSRSHIERVRARFAKEIEGQRIGTEYIKAEGDVTDYRVGPSGRSSRASLYVDTKEAPAPGHYLLEALEALTGGGRWLPVAPVPSRFLSILPEPEDDHPSCESITFYDEHPFG